MAGQSSMMKPMEIISEMKSRDMSSSSNKMGRYKGGDPTCHNNTANPPMKYKNNMGAKKMGSSMGMMKDSMNMKPMMKESMGMGKMKKSKMMMDK